MPSRPTPTRPRARKGLWFPLCVAAVVLLMLPGVVLLILSMLGMEGVSNAWLQERLGVTYHNSLPVWATILLLLLPVVLALLYFLKLRRKAMEVPSTFLWRKSIEDIQVNSLFQWLRDNVLLLVQLCIVLLLVYAALQFQVQGEMAVAGKHYVILIDSSASMSARDVSPDRLSVAKEEALKLIDAQNSDDVGMVIEFNSTATPRQSYTRDKSALRAAVNGIQPTQRRTRIDEALAQVAGLANPLKAAEDQAVRPAGENAAEARAYVNPDGLAAIVHLFSDGRFPDVPNFSAGNLSLQYHRIGAPGPDAVNNVGIVGLTAARDEKDPTKLTVFVRVLNFRSTPEYIEPTLQLLYGRPGDFKVKEIEMKQKGQDRHGKAKDLSIPARVVEVPGKDGKGESRDRPGEGVAEFVLEDVDDAADVVLHVKIKNHRDQFALDDEAFLIAGVVRKARVLIVTSGNEMLMNFFDLEETKKVATVKVIAPDKLKDGAEYRTPAQGGEYDLVVFDRCTPDANALPQANTFFIDAVPPPFQRGPALPKGTLIKNTSSPHPLMRDLSGLDDIAFSGGFRFDPTVKDQKVGVQPRNRLLEAAGEVPLMLVLQRRSFQDVILTFPLVNEKNEWTTTWGLLLSFPVFLRNVLYQLGNVSDAAAEENVQPGDVKVLRPDAAVKRVEIADPTGKRRSLNAREEKDGSWTKEFQFQATDATGVYAATWVGGGRAFAVNLLDEQESNTQPRDEIKLGEQQILAGKQQRRTYDTWKWVAVGALVLLLLEWAMYHRRV